MSTIKSQKPTPDQVVNMLKEGNQRFVSGESAHPNTDIKRLKLAGSQNQGDYAYATVISCSDSRVPVERIFDAGVMDLFIIRVAGNVCNTDEIGSIEYGLAHVNTPVLVVLGHTQCGAVTAVTQGILGKAHSLERNIPPLIKPISPAVKRIIEKNPALKEGDIVPLAIEENVWVGIENLFRKSPRTRELVREGQVKVVGAIYNVGTGEINWLDETKVDFLFDCAESGSDKETEAFAAFESDFA